MPRTRQYKHFKNMISFDLYDNPALGLLDYYYTHSTDEEQTTRSPCPRSPGQWEAVRTQAKFASDPRAGLLHHWAL